MLPLSLLIARTRRGSVKPVYAGLNEANLEAAKILMELFRVHVGKRKGELMEKVRGYEEVGFDFRFIRGLSTLLERRCTFEARSPLDPSGARRLVFRESGKLGAALTKEARSQVLRTVAESLRASLEDLEESLWSDLEEEFIIKEFTPIGPEELLRYYNLCLTQTLLFRSTFLEFTVRGNWKGIFRRMKHLGLMYSAEARPEGFYVAVDGPLSLFKLTGRYGTSLAKLLPSIVEAGGWRLKASILGGREGQRRILQLELREEEVGSLIKGLPQERKEERVFDSSVEEDFARRFQSMGSGWKLIREPEPLIAGSHVMIPDFSFEKGNLKVYMEVVGFWTPEYLDRKLSKLRQLPQVDMIVAVDARLQCSKLRPLKGRVLLYEGEVPMKPIMGHLRSLEERVVAGQVESLKGREIELKEDVVGLGKLAGKLGVSEEALRKSLQEARPKGYRLIGDTLVREARLQEIRSKVGGLPELRLSKVIRLIEEEGLGNPYEVLEALGYRVRWQGLDQEKAVVYEEEKGSDGCG